MEDHIAARLKPVAHTPDEQIVIDRVNRIREAAARILIKASVNPGFHPKPGFYSPEKRMESMVEDAKFIVSVTQGWAHVNPNGDYAAVHNHAIYILLWTNPFWMGPAVLDQVKRDAIAIIEKGSKLYPNQPVLHPAQGLKWEGADL